MESIPKGVYSHVTLRKRWLVLSISLGILGFGIGYLLFNQLLIGFVGSLVGQFLAIVDYIDRRSTANKWIEENTNLVDEKMSNLYYKDEDKHMLMLLLLERGTFSSSKIKEWVIKGRVAFKTKITFK